MIPKATHRLVIMRSGPSVRSTWSDKGTTRRIIRSGVTSSNACRIAAASAGDRSAVRTSIDADDLRELLNGHVEHRFRGGAQIVVPGVPYHPHDLDRLTGHVSRWDFHNPPERTAVGKMRARHGLVDHCDQWSALAVLFSNTSAFEDRHPDCFEITGRDGVESSLDRIFQTAGIIPKSEPVGNITATEELNSRKARGTHSRNLAEALIHLPRHPSQRGRFLAPRVVCDVENQHLLRPEAEINAAQVVKASKEKAGSDQ